MTTMTENQGLRVKEGRIELIVNHLGKDLTFLHPAYGPNTCANVGNEIYEAGLQRPTMAETVSLVHAAFNSDDKYGNEIKDIMKKKWLWGFTGTLYVPNQGAFIQDNPEIRDGMPFMNKDDIVTKLEANDSNVRFVPFGFKTESMTPLELSKNKYVIGLVGQEGAEKLAEVVDKHQNKSYLWSFTSIDEPITRVSALTSLWLFGGHRLGVYGDLLGDSRDGSAFGVKRTGEASRV